MMIIAMVLGLFFLLLGWTLMPLLRYRLKKRMEKDRQGWVRSNIELVMTITGLL